MYRNRSQVEIAFCSNERLTFLFFWGHQPSKSGAIGSECLSQWWPSPFEIDGATYPTAEHWMMAEKARLFGDRETELRVLASKSPREAKLLGRSVRGFDSKKWDRSKLEVVQEGNLQKFKQNSALGEFLMSTADCVLVEASPNDCVWGIGLAVNNSDCVNPLLWRGENLLGFALMNVRERLRSERFPA